MSDRETDPPEEALDPPENTSPDNAMSMDSADEEAASKLDPPENTSE